MLKLNKQNLIIIIFVIFLLVIFSYTFFDDLKPIQLSDELGFYQINTCSFSIMEFQLNNTHTLYQDHYNVRPYNYSSIECFGKITGIDRVKNDFFIAVGFNPLINLVLMTLLLSLLINTKKSRNNKFEILDINFFISLISTTFIFIFLIFFEQRFYGKSIRGLDLVSNIDLMTIAIYLVFCTYFLNYYFLKNSDNLINYFPYMYIFIGVVNGFNFYIFNIIFVFYFIYSSLKKVKYLKYNVVIFSLITIWVLNVESNDYYLDPDKIIGSSGTVYNQGSTFFWSIVFFYSFLGVFLFIKDNLININNPRLIKSFLNSGSYIFFIGFVTQKITILNALAFVLLGQNKPTTRDFNFDISNNWRGFSPSAEHIGEFYGLVLLVVGLSYLYGKVTLNYLDYIKLFFVLLGLILSNNRTAISLVLLVFIISLFKRITKISISSIFILCAMVVFIAIFINNQIYPIEFTSSRILSEANLRSLDTESSSLDFLNNTTGFLNRIIFFVVGFLSSIAFYINRSSLWGMFFARYNPTPLDFLFGTGPYNISKLYNEIRIQEEASFLLPHSSLLQLLLYFGLVGLLYIVFKIYRLLKVHIKNRSNLINLVLFVYFLINLIKSDSIFYFSTCFTLIFFYTLLRVENKLN